MTAEIKLALKVVAGPDEGRLFLLGDANFVGRLHHCEIHLTDPLVAPMHARIGRRGEAYTITDMTDKPEIRVNRHVIMSRRLSLGDTISIANTTFKVIDETLARQELDASRSARPASPEITVVSSELDPSAGKTADLMRESKIATMPRPPTRKLKNKLAPAAPPPAALPVSGDTEPLDAAPEGQTRSAASAGPAHVVDDSQFIKYRAASQMAREDRATRSTRVGWAVAAAILLALGGGFFYLHVQARHTRMVEQFRMVEEFARQNPDRLDETLEKYRQLRASAQGMNSRIDDELVNRMLQLEQEREDRRKQFEQLLVQLDQQAQQFASEDRFEEALGVYEQHADLKARERILAARKVAIQDIRNLAVTREAELKVVREREAEQLKADADQKSRDKLRRLLDSIVDSMIAGQCDDAIRQFRTALADGELAFAKAQLEAALASAETLAATDSRLQGLQAGASDGAPQPGRGIFPDRNNVGLVESHHATIKAIYAIRKDDLLVAQGFLRDAGGHILSDSLLARARLSDEELAREKAAIQACGSVWRRLVRESADRIPVPSDCVAQLKRLGLDRDRKDALAALDELIKCGDDYVGTRFVKKYAELFSAARELRPGLLLAGQASGFGDGKIIQMEGNQVFVEIPESQLDLQDRQIGLFREKTVFFSPGGSTPVLARADVLAVFPCRMLSDRQAQFTMAPSTNLPSPVVGDKVLIGKTLRTGETFLGGDAGAAGATVYSSSFADKLEKTWESTGRNMRIENGRLVLDARRDRRVAGQPDLILRLPSPVETLRVTFTLVDEESQGVSVSVGALDFVVGGQGGQKSGIYARGSLLEPLQMVRTTGRVTQQISVSKLRRTVRLAVNKPSVECAIPAGVSTGGVDTIRFFSDGRFGIDDIKVERVSGGGEARLLAQSPDGREVLIGRGVETGWDTVTRGQPVYFFLPRGADVFERQAAGRVDAAVGLGVVCLVADGQTVGPESLASLTPQLAAAARPGGREPAPVPVAAARPGAPALLFGTVKTADDSGRVEVLLAGSGALPAKGFIAVVKDGVQHPHTREVLAVWCGEPIRCDMTMQERSVVCQLPAGVNLGDKANKGVVVSGTLIPAERKIELDGFSSAFSRMATGGAGKFWDMLGGKWRDKGGRLVSQPAAGSDGVAIVGMADLLGGNAQFDVDVQIEKSGVPPETEWLRDVIVELHFPARRESVAFGVGLGRDQDVQVTGEALNVTKEGRLDRPAGLPQRVVATIEKCCVKNSSLLRAGNEYSLRLRRVRDTVTFYINGKRVARVQYPGLEGDAQLRVAAPRYPVALGKAAARELSSTCTTPETEPLLGEFGYVGWSDGNQIYFDSDIMGKAPGKTVTVLAVDKVVQGEASTSVISRKVGTAMITDVGPRTTRATRVQGEAFEKGMKVMVGAFPTAPVFTDTRLKDVEQGL